MLPYSGLHIWNGGPREESLPLILVLGADNVRVDKRIQVPASPRSLLVGPKETTSGLPYRPTGMMGVLSTALDP